MDTALARPESKADTVEDSEDEAEADAQAHRASAGLCLAACCLWHTDEAAELAPAQVSALRAEIEACVAKFHLQGDVHQFKLHFASWKHC